MKNIKNKLIICFAAVITASALLTGCTGNKAPDRTGDTPSEIPNAPTEAHFVISETAAKKPEHPPITFEEGEKSLTIENFSITAKERINSGASKNMNKEIDESQKEIKDIYADDCAQLRKDLDSGKIDASGFPYKTTVDYTCIRNDGKAITISEKIENYSAGNLITSVTTYYNFEPMTGELVDNPFYDSKIKGAFDEADDVMFKKLNEKYPDTVSYEGLGYPSFVDAAKEYWYFTQDSLKVVFPAGLVAPLESGALEIEYSKEELPEFAQKYFN